MKFPMTQAVTVQFVLILAGKMFSLVSSDVNETSSPTGLPTFSPTGSTLETITPSPLDDSFYGETYSKTTVIGFSVLFFFVGGIVCGILAAWLTYLQAKKKIDEQTRMLIYNDIVDERSPGKVSRNDLSSNNFFDDNKITPIRGKNSLNRPIKQNATLKSAYDGTMPGSPRPSFDPIFGRDLMDIGEFDNDPMNSPKQTKSLESNNELNLGIKPMNREIEPLNDMSRPAQEILIPIASSSKDVKDSSGKAQSSMKSLKSMAGFQSLKNFAMKRASTKVNVNENNVNKSMKGQKVRDSQMYVRPLLAGSLLHKDTPVTFDNLEFAEQTAEMDHRLTQNNNLGSVKRLNVRDGDEYADSDINIDEESFRETTNKEFGSIIKSEDLDLEMASTAIAKVSQMQSQQLKTIRESARNNKMNSSAMLRFSKIANRKQETDVIEPAASVRIKKVTQDDAKLEDLSFGQFWGKKVGAGLGSSDKANRKSQELSKSEVPMNVSQKTKSRKSQSRKSQARQTETSSSKRSPVKVPKRGTRTPSGASRRSKGRLSEPEHIVEDHLF